MPKKLIAIANQIDNDIMQIAASNRWPDVTAGLANILRATKELRGQCALPSVEAGIAAGYHQALEDNIEGLCALVSHLDGDQLLDPRTLGVVEMLANLSAATTHKYMRAAIAAQTEWEDTVKMAENELLGTLCPIRPLDVDGDQEVANG